MHGRAPAIVFMRDESNFADSSRALDAHASKCVLNQQNACPPSRGRSFTHVTMRGKMQPQLLLPALPGRSLSQKCPPSICSKRADLKNTPHISPARLPSLRPTPKKV